MAYSRSSLFAIALVIALGACASAATDGDTGFAEPRRPTTVRVQNHYWSDMAIYVVKLGGSRWRLGTVIAGTTNTLRIPDDLMVGSQVQLHADPVGPETGISFPFIAAAPGSKLELTLEQNLKFSNFWIR